MATRSKDSTIIFQIGALCGKYRATQLTDDPTMIEKLKISFPNYKLFTHRQAQEIVDFLAKRQKEDGNDILVCHCDAGISRSGAVATFACDYCKLNYTTTKDNYGNHQYQ